MALIETFEAPEGVEYVRDVEHEGSDPNEEKFRLFKTAPKEVQVGEVLDSPVYTEVEYFLILDVDTVEVVTEEQAQMMEAFGMGEVEAGETHHDLAVIITSNADGDIGAGIEELEGAGVQEALEVLSNL